MRVKLIYEDKKDKELLEAVKFPTPFFVEYIDVTTRNGIKEVKSIKGQFAFKKNPFIAIYDDEDKFVGCFYSESGNACQQFINFYIKNDCKN